LLAAASSTDEGALQTGLLSSRGVSIRETVSWSGTGNSFVARCFSDDGSAVTVSIAAPSRLRMWDRDIFTGALSGPRIFYTRGDTEK
jgi:hypothetical protein